LIACCFITHNWFLILFLIWFVNLIFAIFVWMLFDVFSYMALEVVICSHGMMKLKATLHMFDQEHMNPEMFWITTAKKHPDRQTLQYATAQICWRKLLKFLKKLKLIRTRKWSSN
jgi:hypothetical protein